MKLLVATLLTILFSGIARSQILVGPIQVSAELSITQAVTKEQPKITNVLGGLFDFTATNPQTTFLTPPTIQNQEVWEMSQLPIEPQHKPLPGEIPEFLSDASLSQAIFSRDSLSLGEFTANQQRNEGAGYETYRLIGEPER